MLGTVAWDQVIEIRMQMGERIDLMFRGDDSLNEKVYLSLPHDTKATCRLIKSSQFRLDN